MDIKEKEQFIKEQEESLAKIHYLYDRIKILDNSLQKLYPVTVVEEDTFYVFDLNSKNKYKFVMEHPTPMPIPEGVMAAFPLEFYSMKPSAIVSKEIFNSLEGYVFIFHEFVHCHQWENGENELKESLEIAKKANKGSDYMWEINHPFPYNDKDFVSETIQLNNHFENRDYDKVLKYHRKLAKELSTIDYEYMIWQQWKEGFARYIENLIRAELSLKLNTAELRKPFNRVSFYDLGSKHIELLVDRESELKGNIKELFLKMY
ncbi:hypothetical protein PRVXH_002051 [Proteinivorax hydrogeniformans]|uniref:DUF2268 domain-containing protein n=1 Tax=Proteinivorax hydrogeniformans TaxID=1826727 RepID=A0AAU8HSG2_9FIRM